MPSLRIMRVRAPRPLPEKADCFELVQNALNSMFRVGET